MSELNKDMRRDRYRILSTILKEWELDDEDEVLEIKLPLLLFTIVPFK